MKTGGEQRREAGEVFGVERLRETVSTVGRLDAQGLCDFIFDQVDRFLAGTVQHDDMALLVVKVSETTILR